jgi:hypothetical protein
MCLEAPEEERHIFFECEGSREAWNMGGLDGLTMLFNQD